MIISGVVMYVVSYIMSMISVFFTFFPPLRIFFMFAKPILKIVGVILVILGAWTIYKNRSKFKIEEEQK